MRIISKGEVKQLINMKDSLAAVEDVFVKYSKGETILPPRPNIGVEEHNGNVLFMPAYIKGSEYLGCKVVTVYPDNPSKNKKTLYATLMLNDATTGEPLAVMDAELLTAYRTGAISGVAAKYLSLPESSVVSIWGAGVQGRTQLEAICAVRNIKKVFVFDINLQNREKFVNEMKELLGIEVVGADNEDEAVAQSDILVTVTTSSKPVIKSTALKPGAYISAVGGSTVNKQEIPDHIVEKCTIVVDGYGAAMIDAGDIMIPMSKGIITRDSIKAELGEVISGKFKRSNNKENILFKTVGLAIQDMAVAPIVYKKALELGLGIDVSL